MSEIIPFLIIGAAVAMIVGPIMLMRPSQRQQREIKLRNRAIELGLRVHMMPLPESGLEAGGSRSRQCAAYCLPWTAEDADINPWLLFKGQYEHEVHFSGSWHWVGKLEADVIWHALLKPFVAELPDTVLAVGNGPQGLSLYWSENGPAEEVERLAGLLSKLQKARLTG